MGIGIVQGIFVVRLLSTADYGLVGVVTAVGSVAGIIMHLGLVSGATREIAAAAGGEKSPKEEDQALKPSIPGPLRLKKGNLDEAFKVFISALLARLAVALPIFLILIFGAPTLAGNVYQHPEIAAAFRLYALVLLVQAPQGIFNAALSGLKKFKSLFVFQVAIALVSLALYVPLIYRFGFYGYFWAMLTLAVVHTIILFLLAIRCFSSSNLRKDPSFPKGRVFPLPTLPEIRSALKKIFSVGLAIYLVKIIFTLWQRFGPLVLGRAASAAEVGVFNFALFYSTKLMTASDAVTDVSLPVFSERFSEDFAKFKVDFLSNFRKVYAFITLAAASAVYWSPELVRFVAGHKYDAALPLIPFLILAFWSYSFVNIIKSSLMVPVKLNREMVISYALLFLGTVGGFYILRHSELIPCHPELGSESTLQAMVWAMVLGGVLALFYQWFSIRKTLKLNIFGWQAGVLASSLLPLVIVCSLPLGFWAKAVIFGLNLGLFGYLLKRLEILSLEGGVRAGLLQVLH